MDSDLGNIPYGIESDILMLEPNAPILIYEGSFDLQDNNVRIEILGKIYFNWVPSIEIKFEGLTETSIFRNMEIMDDKFCPNLLIGNDLIGPVIITNTTKPNSDKRTEIAGIFKENLLIGKKVEVNKVTFAIPNLKSFWGTTFQLKKLNGVSTISGRIAFTCKDFDIILDKRKDYDVLLKKLKIQGGYILLYNGEIKFKKPASYERTKEICIAFGTFLSFLNGRRVGTLFLKGELKEEVLFQDYTRFINDSYQSNHSWALSDLKSGQIEKLWLKFWYLWTQKNARDFLIFSIKWYCEGNSSELSSDTRLIMAQSTLELIFNWWLVELNGLIKGSDSRNLSASNKIRLVLSSCSVNKEIPKDLKDLSIVMNGQAINDGPESIVFVRNALIHAHEKNREKIQKIGPFARFQALKLAVMYIDLALLRILDYEDRYKNNIMGANWVPWRNRV